jgi:hypothetical protein
MKRFRDTNLHREAWYRKLSPDFKCIWDFLCDACDEAGMWTIDLDTLNFFVNPEIEIDEERFTFFFNSINKDRDNDLRIEMYNERKVWITGFCDFQYGELSNQCPPHRKIIASLNKYELIGRCSVRVPDRVPNTLISRVDPTLQEKTIQEKTGTDKEKEEEREEEKENTGTEKKSRKPNVSPEKESTTAARNQYNAEIAAIVDKIDNAGLKSKIAEYIQKNKPAFIEPYIDLWNAAAVGNGLPVAENITDSRIRKMKTRLKEPAFDFVKIMQEIKVSNYLRGMVKPWKVTFNWVFENDTNYIKIIEGEYRNK